MNVFRLQTERIDIALRKYRKAHSVSVFSPFLSCNTKKGASREKKNLSVLVYLSPLLFAATAFLFLNYSTLSVKIGLNNTETLSKLQYGQAQYLYRRNCSFLIKVNVWPDVKTPFSGTDSNKCHIIMLRVFLLTIM